MPLNGGEGIEADAGDVLRRAWDGLLLEVDRAFGVFVDSPEVQDDIDAAEGFRHLLRVMDACIALDVEHGDRRRPALLPLITPTRKIYFDNPDVRYEIARIRGNTTYRLHGRRGSAAYLSVAVHGTLNGGRLISSIGGSDLAPERDGTIDLQLGGGPPPGGGRWLPLDRDADAVVVRQYFTDLTDRSPARLRIEPAVPPGRREPLSEAGLAYDLVKARGKLALAVRIATALGRMGSRPKGAAVLEPVGEDIATPFGAPFGAYVPVRFHLETDEALVVEGPAPQAAYWGAHLANRWGESLDDEDRQVSRNLTTTTLDAAGRYRYIVSHRPVADPNWLDASGHREGFVILRCVHGDAPGPPAAQVVPVTTFDLVAQPVAQPVAGPALARLEDDGRRALADARDALLRALRRSADRIDGACRDAGADPVDRAEGYRSITRLLAKARESVVEQATTSVVRPQLADRAAGTSTGTSTGGTIVRPGQRPGPAPLASSGLGSRVHALARTVERTASTAIEALDELAAAPNEIDLDLGSPAAAALHPTPDRHLVIGWFRIAPDQALVVEGPPSASRHWSIQLWNRWGEALGPAHHTAGRSSARPSLRSEGTYRFVLAHEDPGATAGRWIDLVGHQQGVICLRWTHPPAPPELATRLVELGSLPQ